MTGKDLVEKYGQRASIGTDVYGEATWLRAQLQKLGYAVRIVSRLKSGGNKSGLGTYRVTWWPKPE